ncbi:SPL family radical SAM protein [Paenibacillus mucilaginosus]|uniref:Radical SAM domain protein n=1 Tax=Paenibacillus mucilaginosus (strain KNP414) TaxID=1036673 RepID=F8FMI2_PAEMK|nr:radical SAM protein [Paenibacillus mucilaginosus]AEI40065.1 Radical SAM domain protein [Paenibacillus mucilaginosus KNP414]MCG7215672.1 radical SAM protein [Paenibacillus mucilaginosus]
MKTTYEPLHAKQILNGVKAPSMPFDWSINPYRGCQHGCSFCYARSTHAFLGLGTDDAFQHQILYKANAGETLEAQLDKMLRSRGGREKLAGRIAIGTATDPYQPIEAREMLTRRCLEALVSRRIPVSVTTRSPLILRDLDLLRQLPGSSVNISLNTMNKEVWRGFEPMTPSPEKRLEALTRLREAGVTAGIFLAPILPFLTDSEQELETVVRRSREAGASFVMGSPLRLSTREVKSWFFGTVRGQYPQLLSSYARLYAGSGYPSDAYRREVRTRLHALLERYGIPEYRHDPESPAAASASGPAAGDSPVQLSFTFE